jgi:hypothetical protein
MVKAGVKYDTLWSVDLKDGFFLTACGGGWRESASGTMRRMYGGWTASSSPRGRNSWARCSRRSCGGQGHHGRVRRGLHGMYKAIIPDELPLNSFSIHTYNGLTAVGL